MQDLFPGYFARQDETLDSEFYRQPRLVAHIDDAAMGALRDFLRQNLPAHADILDVMSAYVSHLPDDVSFGRVVGLGMNNDEMAANRQLDSHVVHDLNQSPILPFPDAAFDAALCTVSVQYLLHPVEVFADVARVLRPGSPFFVSFSNRCFPTKATRLWMNTDDAQHADLVKLFFSRSGVWNDVRIDDISPNSRRSDPLFVVSGRKKTKQKASE